MGIKIKRKSAAAKTKNAFKVKSKFPRRFYVVTCWDERLAQAIAKAMANLVGKAFKIEIDYANTDYHVTGTANFAKEEQSLQEIGVALKRLAIYTKKFNRKMKARGM